MSHVLEIAGNVFLIAVIAGFAAWVLWRSLKRSEDAAKLIFKWILTAVVGGFIFKVVVPGFAKGGFDAIFGLICMLICGVAMMFVWRNSIIDLVANPIGALYDGGNEPPEPKPLYSIALAKRKAGRPLEAIVELRAQLTKFPNDFEGVMMLASIQAEDLKDLPGAELTFEHFCAQSEPPPRQVAAAFTQLADWHLKLFQDVDSARAALEKIVQRYPDTELSLLAEQRLAHFGGTEKILSDALNRRAVFVPAGVNNVGLLDSSAHLIPAGDDPTKLAGEYVKHLAEHPGDTDVREKLAVIYADHYQRLDMAALELEQLAGQPNQPPKRVGHWLNLLATLQVRHGADYDTVRATLERIVERFPGVPVADGARSRLARLRYEIKGQKETPSKKLGVYEQNIGLKYGSPRKL
jgi:TolA-binding protein